MTDDVAWALAQDVAAPAMEICLQAPYSILVISLDFGDRTCKLGIASGSDDQLSHPPRQIVLASRDRCCRWHQ